MLGHPQGQPGGDAEQQQPPGPGGGGLQAVGNPARVRRVKIHGEWGVPRARVVERHRPAPTLEDPVPYAAAEDRYDTMPYRRCGRSGLKLPARLAGPVAQLRRRPPARDPAGDPAPRLRPRRHPLRPREQLRPALRLGRRRTSAGSSPRTSGPTATSSSSRPRRAGTCGPARTASAGRASTCSRASTRACSAWALDYVDIFYSHRPDPDTPLEETMGALADGGAAGQGALRRHLVLLARAHRARRRAILRRARDAAADPPAVATRCSTAGSRTALLDTLDEVGAGCDRVLPARAGHAHRPLPRRHPRGLAGGAGGSSLSSDRSGRGEPRRRSAR